ncbi:MAG: hypothetical protein HFK08_04890 [Clostridia bacterium]|nr:hypothetical protein [Clostridia bacterium]
MKTITNIANIIDNSGAVPFTTYSNAVQTVINPAVGDGTICFKIICTCDCRRTNCGSHCRFPCCNCRNRRDCCDCRNCCCRR